MGDETTRLSINDEDIERIANKVMEKMMTQMPTVLNGVIPNMVIELFPDIMTEIKKQEIIDKTYHFGNKKRYMHYFFSIRRYYYSVNNDLCTIGRFCEMFISNIIITLRKTILSFIHNVNIIENEY